MLIVPMATLTQLQATLGMTLAFCVPSDQSTPIWRRLSRMRKWYLAATVLVIVLGVLGLIYMFAPVLLPSGPQAGAKVTDPKQLATMAIAFVAPPYEDDYQALRVSGFVENHGKTPLAAVTITVELRDSAGAKKESVNRTFTDLRAGQRKTYDIAVATFSGPRTATVKVTSALVAK